MLFINEKSITKWQPLNKTKGIVCFFIFFSLSIMSLISFINPSSGSEFDEELSKNRIIIPDNFNFTGAIRTHYQSE
ncbi:MAG TPA: hypothetical protein VN316_02825, partial [candidate division Zixibacteria bacterium]|nr:hypothetical protein [candidate division Zixibacteria bacterium]